jgi:hypothetical protein
MTRIELPAFLKQSEKPAAGKRAQRAACDQHHAPMR